MIPHVDGDMIIITLKLCKPCPFTVLHWIPCPGLRNIARSYRCLQQQPNEKNAKIRQNQSLFIRKKKSFKNYQHATKQISTSITKVHLQQQQLIHQTHGHTSTLIQKYRSTFIYKHKTNQPSISRQIPTQKNTTNSNFTHISDDKQSQIDMEQQTSSPRFPQNFKLKPSTLQIPYLRSSARDFHPKTLDLAQFQQKSTENPDLNRNQREKDRSGRKFANWRSDL